MITHEKMLDLSKGVKMSFEDSVNSWKRWGKTEKLAWPSWSSFHPEWNSKRQDWSIPENTASDMRFALGVQEETWLTEWVNDLLTQYKSCSCGCYWAVLLPPEIRLTSDIRLCALHGRGKKCGIITAIPKHELGEWMPKIKEMFAECWGLWLLYNHYMATHLRTVLMYWRCGSGTPNRKMIKQHIIGLLER